MSTTLAAAKQAKNQLRKEIQKTLKTLTDVDKQIQSSIISKKVFDLDVYKRSHRISIYLPMKEEVDTLSILRKIFEDGKDCFIPHFEGPNMIMVHLKSWQAYEALPINKWGIKQPTSVDLSEDATLSGGLDLIFMPGLAFTCEGYRLGRGKGYYDKYLEKCQHSGKMPSTVALLFKEQLVEHVPVLDHDKSVDVLVYPTMEEYSAATVS